ncbi:Response regulator rcp1 [Thalassocella blandensis]|nr:Response regulator rcp1 [Thalassocella blandensis]
MNENNRYIVYLADDDADDQYLVRSAFNKLEKQPELLFFNNGLELVEHLEANKLNKENNMQAIVLLDLNMPTLNGKDTLQRIKSSQTLKNLPVVIYSTSESNYDVQEAYQLGANAFITKPERFMDMVTVIKRLYEFWFETVELV